MVNSRSFLEEEEGKDLREKKKRKEKESLGSVEARKAGLLQQSKFVCSCVVGVVKGNDDSQVVSLRSFRVWLLSEGQVKHFASSVRTRKKGVGRPSSAVSK